MYFIPSVSMLHVHAKMWGGGPDIQNHVQHVTMIMNDILHDADKQ